MRSNLYSYIRSIFSKFPTLKQIYARVKKHAKLKYSTTDSIRNTYARLQADKELAKQFNKASAKVKVNELWLGCGKKKGGILKVDYHFQFNFGGRGSSGKSGRRAVYDSIDLPVGLTKSEINAAVREKIREFANDHSTSGDINTGTPQFTVDLIQAC